MAKILLVEDEINIASFIERGLKEFGHSVTVCHDGDTGWKILQDKPFDLLILDIILLKDVWDKNFDTNTNIVDVYVNYLRVKIDRDFDKKLIHTVVGLGYIMNT